MYATKTTYINSFISGFLPDKIPKPKNCTPIQIIGLFRHGTRYPSKKNILIAQKIVKDLEERKVNQALVSKLKKVVENELNIGKQNKLSEIGAREHFDIGKRVASNFFKLYVSCKSSEMLFKTSSTERTFNSCEHFQKGFRNVFPLLLMDIKIDDFLLRFFDKCPNYISTVKENKAAMFEYETFLKLSVKKINRLIAENLNIEKLEMTGKEQEALYCISGCEYAVTGNKIWGDIIPEEAKDILEYTLDIKKFYDSGYGNEMSSLQSCHLFTTFFQHMDNIIDKKIILKGAFYFAHAETLLPFMSLMGLFKDTEPLKHSNYDKMKKRRFRTSFICPFAANVMFVLYDCNKTFKIQVLHDEVPILLPQPLKADNDLLYEYSDFKKHYKEVINCEFDKICRVKTQLSSSESEVSSMTTQSFDTPIRQLMTTTPVINSSKIKTNKLTTTEASSSSTTTTTSSTSESASDTNSELSPSDTAATESPSETK